MTTQTAFVVVALAGMSLLGVGIYSSPEGGRVRFRAELAKQGFAAEGELDTTNSRAKHHLEDAAAP
jgi:hypothetical protein